MDVAGPKIVASIMASRRQTTVSCASKNRRQWSYLIFGYSFSRQVWQICLDRIHVSLQVCQEMVFEWWLLRSRKLIPKLLRRGFNSMSMLLGWMLWKERNAQSFDRATRMPLQLADAIFDEAQAWCVAGNKHPSVLLARR